LETKRKRKKSNQSMEISVRGYRRNCFLHDANLTIQKILEESADPNHSITEDSIYFKRFCVIMERIFKFELIETSESFVVGFFSGSSGYSKVLENLPKVVNAAAGSVQTIWEMSVIKTADGRGRAWIALALMEKKLQTYLNAMIKNPSYLSEYYSRDSIWLVKEDAKKLMALIAPLKDVNFSLFFKGSRSEFKGQIEGPTFWV